jgi:ElaB/YqjD/DUF883 family membrane-anchored ribosome-binding protein
VEKKLELAVYEANKIIDTCQENAISVFGDRMDEIGRAIDLIEKSEFTQKLIAKLEEKFNSLPDNVRGVLYTVGETAQKAGSAMLQNAYKAGTQGGLKLANFSGSNVHNIVLKAGHAMKFKFKPWQAVKIAKGVAVTGQVLSVLGVGLSIFLQIKEDRDKEKQRIEIKNNRQNIRSQFSCVANELEGFGRLFIQENVAEPIDTSIRGLDSNVSEIRCSRDGKNDLCKELEAIQQDCRELIREIHTA